MHIGVLGGTFDPPHIGHLVLAAVACQDLRLDRVLWAPAANPPHKTDEPISPIEMRLEMLRRTLAGNPAFEISRVDIDRPGPHYTVDMLSILHQEYPGAALTFLMGGDSLCDLLKWRDPARLISLARLGVMERTGCEYDLDELEAHLPGLSRQLTIIDAPLIDISSSDLALRVARGRTIRYMVPEAVEAYIHEHRLYVSPARERG
jgi:nicotinate-nucleotide adenylyltransferase